MPMYADDPDQVFPLSSRLTIAPIPSPPTLLDRFGVSAPPEVDDDVDETTLEPTPRDELPEGSGDPDGLLGRLWNTKVVAFPSREGDEEPIEEDEDVEVNEVSGEQEEEESKAARLKQGDPSAIRPTALFVTSTAIQSLSTSQILSLLSQILPSRPLGLEWVDDQSVCILWKSAASTRAAFEQLTGEEVPEQTVESALDFSVIDTAGLGIEKGVDGEEQAFYVRVALGSDVKQQGAAQKSQYYRDHQRQTRREASKPYGRRGDRRTARGPTSTTDLDDELEQYLRQNRGKESLDQDLESMAEEREREDQR